MPASKSNVAVKRKVAAEFKTAMQKNRQSRGPQPPPLPPRKGAGKQVVVIRNKDSTKTTIPVKEYKRIKRMAASEIPEKIVTLLKANTIFCTSADFPIGVNGAQDLNWEEVAESVIFSRLASDPQYAIPIGPAALKMYLLWFMLHRLRIVGGLTPEPTYAQLPSFPDNGALPVGWAKFVEYLMPFEDPKTKTRYQFKYNFTGLPTTTSGVLNPTAASTDTGFGALGNFALIPNPVLPTANLEDTWIFTNTAYTFLTVTTTAFDDLSRYISSIGQYVEAIYVPLWAPDASACAIPYGHGSPNPGVYCQSEFFDEEMACIIHPPINVLILNLPVGSAYNMLYPFDWLCKPLPQVFIQSPIKPVAGNPNLASQGQLELILNYGYITQNCCFTTGARRSFLANGQRLWPNLRSYCPYYYVLNLSGWHQFVAALLAAIAFQGTSNSAVNAVSNNVYFNTSDIATVWAALESIMIARCTEFAYAGLILWTSDDVVSQTNYGSDFRTANINPVMADMLDTIAPTVKNGRLSVPVYDYRNYVLYGMTYQGAITNPNVARWAQIGTNYGAAANLNLFEPLGAGAAFTGYSNGPWVVPFTASLIGDTWQVRGPGTTGANQFLVSEVSQGQTFPLPANYVLTNTLCPLAPCRTAANFIIRLDELFSAGTGTWLDLTWAKLGGYQNQTQLTAKIVASNVILGTNNVVPQSVSINFMSEPIRLGAYFPLDKESVGRSFAYATRIAFVGLNGSPVNNDRYPAIQSLSGNSPPQDSLIMNTQQGGNSNFNQVINATMSQGLHQMEALRAALGNYHSSLIANFAGEEMTVAQAVEVIIRCKVSSSTAPYHTESSASLVSYNSPSIFESFINSIFDIGNNIVGGVSNLIGGVSGLGSGLLASPLVQNVGSTLISDFLLQRKAINIPNHVKRIAAASPPASVGVHPIMFKAKNIVACKLAAKKLANMNVVHTVMPDDPPEVDYDAIAERVKDLLTMSQFSKITLA